MMPKTYFSAPLSKSAKDTEGRIRNIFEGQRRRPAIIVLAIVAAAALLCGSVVAVRSKSAVASRESEVTAEVLAARAEEVTELPRFAYQGDDPYLAAVCEWTVRGGEQARYWEAEVTIPAPLIADIDDSDPQDIRVWGNFWSFNYTSRGTTLFFVSGGERPGLLHLRAKEGGYQVFDEEMVGYGDAYAKDMRRIFGTIRMMKLNALDSKTVLTQYIANYVLQNDLPFTQYQDYGWNPVHIPGTPETPESAQRVRYADPVGWSVDYDLREFSLSSFSNNETGLAGVGDLEGIHIDFERYDGTTAEAVIALLAEQMKQPTQKPVTIGAKNIPATMLRDGTTRDEVVKDIYVIALNETDALTVTVRNTYYAVSGDPVVSGGKEALEKTIKTFRLAAPHNQALWANASPETGDVWIAEHMTVAPALSPDRSDIAMELVSADGEAVTVALSNHGSEVFMYGEDFSLQVELDGTWYVVPATPGENWGFPSTANILRPSETNEIACSLAMYGELPHGTYRIVKEGLAVEFIR